MVFLGDIAFYMAALVFAAGIYMIHHANHHDGEEKCKLLKCGGYIVTVIAVLGFLCTGYYWIKYYAQGAYERPAAHSMMMKPMGGGMCTPGMENCPMMDNDSKDNSNHEDHNYQKSFGYCGACKSGNHVGRNPACSG